MSDIIGTAPECNFTTSLNPIEQELDGLSPSDLEARRRSIIQKAAGDYNNLDDDDLARLAYVTSTLRKRASGPPKTPKVAGAKKPKATLDDLL